MSTIFESLLYSRRKTAGDFVHPHPLQLLRHLARNHGSNDDTGEAHLRVCYRHSVASREWWTVQWEQAGYTQSASAQELDLCLWRAIQIHDDLERTRHLEYRWQPHFENGAGI